MGNNRIIQIITDYGDEIDPLQDMNMAEAMNIIESSHTRLETAENAYLYGHMRGSYDNGLTRQIPLYNIRQISDDEWQELSSRNKQSKLSHI